MITHLNLQCMLRMYALAMRCRVFGPTCAVEITKTYTQRLRELAAKDVGLAIDGVWARIVGFDELIAWHGMGAVFRRRQLRVFNATRVPLAAWAVRSIVAPLTTSDRFDRQLSLLDEIGKGLLRVLPQELPIALDDFGSYVFDDSDQSTRAEKKAEEQLQFHPAPSSGRSRCLLFLLRRTRGGRHCLRASTALRARCSRGSDRSSPRGSSPETESSMKRKLRGSDLARHKEPCLSPGAPTKSPCSRRNNLPVRDPLR